MITLQLSLKFAFAKIDPPFIQIETCQKDSLSRSFFCANRISKVGDLLCVALLY